MKKLFKKLALMVVVLLTFSVGSNYTVKEVKAADGAGSWTLVKDASVLSVGDKVVIAAQSSKYAMSTTQNKNNRASVAVEKVGETLTYIASIQTLTLEAGTKENTYAFNTGDGYLYAASSKSNHLKTGFKNDNASWTIEITNAGVATIKAQGTNSRNWMRYNSQSGLFSCYGSGQADICLYKASGEKEVEGLVSSKFDNISILFGATVDSELFKDYNSVSGGVYICAGETFDASKAVKKPVSIEAGKGYSVGAVLNIIEDGKPVDSSTKERLSQKFTAVVYFEVNGQELLLNSKTVCVKDMVDIYLSDDYSNEQSIKENKIALEELQAFIKSASGGN